MKAIFFFAIILHSYKPVSCQAVLSSDSVYYAHVDSILDMHVSEYSISRNVFEKNATDLCNAKRFAYLIDKLFTRGLDIHAKLLPGVRDNTMTYYLEEKPEKVVYNNTDLYLNFIQIKSVYEKEFFNKHDSPEYILMINELVKYSTFLYPQHVENFLLHKYRHFTKEKFYEDIRDAMKNK